MYFFPSPSCWLPKQVSSNTPQLLHRHILLTLRLQSNLQVVETISGPPTPALVSELHPPHTFLPHHQTPTRPPPTSPSIISMPKVPQVHRGGSGWGGAVFGFEGGVCVGGRHGGGRPITVPTNSFYPFQRDG